MAYDRDVIVDFMTNYYALLVRMAYLDPAVVQHPPAQGWSDEQLVVDILQALGRSEKVIDLLRHLPYLRNNYDDEEWQVFPDETKPISYLRDVNLFRGETAESCSGRELGDLLLMPFAEKCPPGLISLTYGHDATCWIIDTDEGLIYPSGMFLEDDTAADDEPWRKTKPRDIKAYFDGVYNDTMNLKIVPGPRAGYWEPRMLFGEGPEGQIVRRLLIEHGWPDALQREVYLRAVAKEREEYINRVTS